MTAQTSPALSARQRAVLDFIAEFVAANHFPPTVREIAAAVGLSSPSSAAHHVRTLTAAGHLTHVPGSPRSIALTNQETP